MKLAFKVPSIGLFSTLNSADRLTRNLIYSGLGLSIIFNVGNIAMRDRTESPQAKDIHTSLQINITADDGKLIVISNGEPSYEGLTGDEDVDYKKFKTMDDVAAAGNEILRANESIGLRSIRVSGQDVVDGDNYGFYLPNGRGPSGLDAEGKKIPVASLTLGNKLLAYQAIGEINDQLSLFKSYDAVAKKPNGILQEIGRYGNSWFWSQEPVKWMYDHRPRFKL